MLRKPLALAAAVLAAAIFAPAAHAAIVPGQVIDGPSADVLRFADVDLAPDGTGALVYTKKDTSGNPEVWASVFNGTSWGSPQMVSNTTVCPASTSCVDPHVAAGNGGRVLVVFKANGNQLQAVLKSDSASAFGTPVDAAPGSDGKVLGDDVDMDPVSGVAYAVIDQNGPVSATRLSGTTWTDVDAGGNIDGTTTDDVGNVLLGSQTTARVAVDTAGNAVVVWRSQDAGMHQHVFARRVNGTTSAASSIEIDVPSLAGKLADGANADSIVVDGGGSSNPWIAIREQFTYASGRVRIIARQLVGDTPGPAQVIDGLPLDDATEGAESPRIAVNPAGVGLAASARQVTFQTFGSFLSAGNWVPGFRLDAGTPTANGQPNVAIANSGNGISAWMDSSAGTTFVNAREEVAGATGAPFTLSRPGDGAILTTLDAPIGMSSSAAGTVAVAFGQGDGATNDEIVAAVVDLPQPSGPGGGGGGNPTAKPAVSKLRLSRTVFAQGSKLATVSKRSKKHKVGTTISFNVSLASTTTFTFLQKAKGFKSGRRCVAHRPKGHRRAKRCTHFVKKGALKPFTTAAGTHKVHFEGRLSRKKRLKPGRYRLSVVSANSLGKSKARTASFRLLRK